MAAQTVEPSMLDEVRASVRTAIRRHDTVEAARAATGAGAAPSRWDVCVSLDLPGALVPEQNGGLGFGAAEATACLEEFARVLAPVPLAGHWGASRLLDLAGSPLAAALASGNRLGALSLARPPAGGLGWVTGAAGEIADLPEASEAPDGWSLSGNLRWVPDAAEADLLVIVARSADGVAAFAVEADAPGLQRESVVRYDHTTALGHLRLATTPAVRLDLSECDLRTAWSLAQAFTGAEALGVARTCLEMALTHAKERYAFSRPIGSYQAIKHRLVEVLRLVENAENCLLWFATEWSAGSDTVPLAGAAVRLAGERAQQYAAASNIFVHGGMGATWEHDAPYFYRRSQLRRMLLAGADNAAVEVGAQLVRAAREEALDD